MKPTRYPLGTKYNARGRMWSLGRHTGRDWLTPTGSRLVAQAAGTVRSVGYNSAYGYNVIIETKNAKGQVRRISLNHLRKGGIVVKTGQKVRAGQLIGYSGATGNVSGPHCHEEDRQAPFNFGDDVNPSEFDTWENQPRVVIPKPKKAPARWFGIDMRNLALFNEHGRDTWNARYSDVLKDIKYVGREVVVVLELSNPQVSRFVASMNAIGYDHAGGYNGRHVFQKRHVQVLDDQAFNIKPTLKGDKKAGYMALLKPTEHAPVIVAVTQLENEDASGDTQVKQAADFLKRVLAWAVEHDVPKDRVFFVLDGNSDSRVYVEVFQEANFMDTAETAWSSENSAWRTFVGWFRKPTKGARIDLILAYRTRPVRRFRIRTQTANLGDHLDLFADFGKR